MKQLKQLFDWGVWALIGGRSSQTYSHPDGEINMYSKLLIVFAIVCCVWSGCRAADDPLPRGPVKAVVVAEGPKIDGTLNDPVWQSAPPLVLGEVTGRGQAAFKTVARVLFDRKFMYVGFECRRAGDGVAQKRLRHTLRARSGTTIVLKCFRLSGS